MAVQTELHRHLDISIRTSTLLKLAQERGYEDPSLSLKAFKSKLYLKSPEKDLKSVLDKFLLFTRVLDKPEVLEQVGFEVVEDCYNEGTRKAELRFSPSFVALESDLTWVSILDSFEAGMKRALAKYPDMKAGLICIGSRDLGVDEVAKSTEFFLKHKSRFIALDLAGEEVGYPCRDFAYAMKPALGENITIHAGEATGPENVWEAIDLLGAKRIGHGVKSIQDPKLVATLAERKICLEICPSSNWVTQSAQIDQSPLPALLRAGVPVCINTDDPGIFGVDLPHEIKVAKKHMGLSEKEIEACMEHAEKYSFL